MVRQLLIKVIRLRNPGFRFDPAVSVTMMVSLIVEKAIALIRGNILLLLHFKRPSLLFTGKGVSVFASSNITIGRLVQLGRHVHLSGLGTGGLAIGKNCTIGSYSQLVVSTSFNNIGKHIRIGDNTGIGEFAYLGGGGGLEIGNDCIIGQYLSCHPENHLIEDNTSLIRKRDVSRKGIVIGKNCWIGARVTILDGVTIGDHCVIAAGAVVNKSFPSGSLIGGVPARLIRPIVEIKPGSEISLPENQTLFQ